MSRYAKRKDTAMLKEIGFAVLAAMGIHGCALVVEPVQFEAPDLASPIEWAALEVAEHVEPAQFATEVSFEEPEQFAEEFADDSPERFVPEEFAEEEFADESREFVVEPAAEEPGGQSAPTFSAWWCPECGALYGIEYGAESTVCPCCGFETLIGFDGGDEVSPEVYVDEVAGEEYEFEELAPGCDNPPEGAAWCDSCGEMHDASEATTELSCPECGIDGLVCDSCAEWHEHEAHAE